jgi:hypothetical protein
MFIVFSAGKRGVARVTPMRMVLKLAIEGTLGAIPVVGDMAHIAWQANRLNYNSLVRGPTMASASHVARLGLSVDSDHHVRSPVCFAVRERIANSPQSSEQMRPKLQGSATA